RMAETDRLSPLLTGRRFVRRAELSAGLSGKGRRKGMLRRPPNLGSQTFGTLAEGLNSGGKQERLCDGDGLRSEILLGSLAPKCGERGGREHTGHYFGASILECANLG